LQNPLVNPRLGAGAGGVPASLHIAPGDGSLVPFSKLPAEHR
jgi:hypothetical protein